MFRGSWVWALKSSNYCTPRHKPPPPQTSKVCAFPDMHGMLYFQKALGTRTSNMMFGICLAIFWWTMFRHLQCIIYFFVQRHLAASRPSRGRRNMQRWPKQIQTLPQTWLYQPLDQKLKIPLKWNMKSSQNKSSSALPQIWLSGRSTLKLSVSFQALCDKVKWKPDAADKSPCTWEGWAVVSAQFGDQEVTQFVRSLSPQMRKEFSRECKNARRKQGKGENYWGHHWCEAANADFLRESAENCGTSQPVREEAERLKWC